MSSSACRRASLSLLVTLAPCMLAAGCSAIVAPDLTRLGGGEDSGLAGIDAGPSDRDGGPMELDAGPLDLDVGARPDVPGLDVGPGCVPGCRGGALTTCTGGTPTVATCDLGCAPGGAARCGEMVPSNVTAALLTTGSRDLIVDASGAAFDTSTCAAVSVDSMVVAQSGGPELCVLVVRQVRIDGILSITGRRPLAIIASDAVDIAGVIDAAAELARPGPGGGNGGTPSMRGGTGPAPGAGGEHVGTYADGGGGGGGYCGVGGDGGSGSTTPFARGGVGGIRIDPRELSPLVAGSGGGVGPGGEPAVGRGNSGLGGGGGGAVQISSPVRIRISGSIVGGGGGGIGGRNLDAYVNWGAGGGGGSGGAVLLEAPEIEIDGRLVATGGAGASSGGSGFVGINGEDGLDLLAAAGGPASSSASESYSAAGGDSGGGAVADALDGESNAFNNSNGGGGGGGAGCLVIRTAGAMDPGGARSPSSIGVSVLAIRLR